MKTDDEGTGEGTKTRIEETIPDTMDMDTEEQHETYGSEANEFIRRCTCLNKLKILAWSTHEASSSERGNSNGRKTAGNDDPSKVSSDCW